MLYDVSSLPLPATVRPEDAMDDDALLAFCRANDGLRIERESSGEIVMMTPAGGQSDRRGLFLAGELDHWAEEDGRGVAFGSSAGFILADGSMLSPDPAWVRSEVWEALTPEQQEKLLPFCPGFVIEVLSRSDSLQDAKAKMEKWMANGAGLGWLFDPYRKMLSIYRASTPGMQEILSAPASIEAAKPVEGFQLLLRRIWDVR
jgi:Uma2 family endonuclease